MLKFVSSVTSIFRRQFMPLRVNSPKPDEFSFLPQSVASCDSDAHSVGKPFLHPSGVTIGHEFATLPVEDQHLQQWRLAQEADVSDFYVLKTPMCDAKRPSERKPTPKLNSEYFLRAFLKQCSEHQSFLTDSICIDEHILSAAYIYYRWARVPIADYKNEELFFSALFLYDSTPALLYYAKETIRAWQVQEDSHKGEYEILEYLYGEPPRVRRTERANMSKRAKSLHRRLIKAYKRNVLKFMEIKDKLWRQLDYRVNIEPELVWTVVQYLKKYDTVFDIDQCNRELHFLLELNDSDTELTSLEAD